MKYGYLIGEGFGNVFKNKKSTGASLMIMCATMIIFGIFLILGENINHFVDQVKSEQGFQVFLNTDATEEEISKIEKAIFQAGAMSRMLDEKLTLKEIAEKITGDKKVKVIDASKVPVYECECSKEKFADSLVTLGKDQLRELIEEDEQAEIKCQFCNKEYHFNKEELKEIYKRNI